MSTGMMGVGFFDTGHRTPRTRDWSRPDDSQRANPARLETPEEKRKREWDESCRQETARVLVARAENLKRMEAERLAAEAARRKHDFEQRRAAFLRGELEI